MILNDSFDVEEDVVARPRRPIPSGAISRRTGFTIGFGCLLLAMLIPIIELLQQTCLTTCVGWPGFDKDDIRQLGVIWLLAGAILLYNGMLKQTFLAPTLMGSCRTLNILLGGTAFLAIGGGSFRPELLWYAASIGVFIAGVTMLSRSETDSNVARPEVARSGVVMLTGLLMIAATPLWLDPSSDKPLGETIFIVMIGLLAAPIVYRLFLAIRNATPGTIVPAIVTSLTSLIFLDAAFCYLVRPGQPLYAGMVALLVVPVILLRPVSAQT